MLFSELLNSRGSTFDLAYFSRAGISVCAPRGDSVFSYIQPRVCVCVGHDRREASFRGPIELLYDIAFHGFLSLGFFSLSL